MTWEDDARRDLEPKMRGSAFVISINPREIDPKIALETGYAVLLGKPILLLVTGDTPVNPGLERLAHKVVRVDHDLASMDSQLRLQAAIAELQQELGS